MNGTMNSSKKSGRQLMSLTNPARRSFRKLNPMSLNCDSVGNNPDREQTMNLFKKLPFSFEDEDYEVRIYFDDTLITVISFKNNYPANGLRHQIKLSKKQSAEELLNSEVIGEMVEITKGDIIERRWSRLNGQ